MSLTPWQIKVIREAASSKPDNKGIEMMRSKELHKLFESIGVNPNELPHHVGKPSIMRIYFRERLEGKSHEESYGEMLSAGLENARRYRQNNNWLEEGEQCSDLVPNHTFVPDDDDELFGGERKIDL
jgi:hypothetical protein